jgi:hypothetical protein
MKQVPFSEQVRRLDPLQAAVSTLRYGDDPTNEELARAVEHCGNKPLPPVLRDRVVLVLSGKFKAKTGRKPVSEAKLAFLMPELDPLYKKLHAEFSRELKQQRKLGEKGMKSARQLAYEALLKHFNRDLPNLDWATVCNLHSRWRRGTLVKLHEHPDDADELP